MNDFSKFLLQFAFLFVDFVIFPLTQVMQMLASSELEVQGPSLTSCSIFSLKMWPKHLSTIRMNFLQMYTLSLDI